VEAPGATRESDAFAGAWRVREYVHEPSGALVGTVRQRRRVVQLGGNRIRVIQDCELDPSLLGHAMAGFAGHHEFELAVEGRVRRYGGPAVIGSGVQFGDCATWGRGLWPEFGYAFESYGIVVESGLQLTGGRFSRAGVTVANIVGVATTDSGNTAPALANQPPTRGIERSAAWTGRMIVCGPTGEPRGIFPLKRQYEAPGDWIDVTGGETARFQIGRVDASRPGGPDGRVEGEIGGQIIQGFAREFGAQLEIEMTCGGAASVGCMEVLDSERGHLVGFRRWVRDHVLERVDVLCLRAVTPGPKVNDDGT